MPGSECKPVNARSTIAPHACNECYHAVLLLGLRQRMTDRPILFSGPMVRALLEGRKTQTRRLAWRLSKTEPGVARFGEACVPRPTLWQKVKPGDRLWVRETWLHADADHGREMIFAADNQGYQGPWRPSIHMSRWASRITLVVTDVRRERVQDLSYEDCLSEGFRNETTRVEGHQVIVRDMREKFIDIIGRDVWGQNAEVVALTFTVHQCNIDSMIEAA